MAEDPSHGDAKPFDEDAGLDGNDIWGTPGLIVIEVEQIPNLVNTSDLGWIWKQIRTLGIGPNAWRDERLREIRAYPVSWDLAQFGLCKAAECDLGSALP